MLCAYQLDLLLQLRDLVLLFVGANFVTHGGLRRVLNLGEIILKILFLRFIIVDFRLLGQDFFAKFVDYGNFSFLQITATGVFVLDIHDHQ
jgi:hypothetical protein